MACYKAGGFLQRAGELTKEGHPKPWEWPRLHTKHSPEKIKRLARVAREPFGG
jgi:hypothetical protein